MCVFTASGFISGGQGLMFGGGWGRSRHQEVTPTGEKWSKKLDKFFKQDATSSKRIKSLSLFCKDSSREDVAQLFQTKHRMIYDVVSSALYDLSARSNQKEWIEAVEMLGQCLKQLKTQIHQGWQASGFFVILVNLVRWENIYDVRLRGLGLMLRFMDIMHDKGNLSSLSILGAAANFTPFIKNNRKRENARQLRGKDLNRPSEYAFARDQPRDLMVQQEESCNLLQVLLNFTRSAIPDRFPFWFQFLKKWVFCYL